MRADLHLRPGIRVGAYPQKSESELTPFEQSAAQLLTRLKKPLTRRRHNLKSVVRQVEKHEQPLAEYTDAQLDALTHDLRAELYRKGLREDLILRSFALIRQVSLRVLGKRHYDVQVFGGWLMINGMLAEMETGEGKTLATTLPACTAALAGIPVHVITANDYLAARDCELMQPLYERLGISAQPIVDGMETEPRQQAYGSDIVHTTHQQVAFDYLRDRIEMGDDTGALKTQFRHISSHLPGARNPYLLRGLCFALVDEADSVLIDDARTPLIITRPIQHADSSETYSDALYLASALFPEQDYTIDHRTRHIELTQQGEDRLTDLIINLPRVWRHKLKREMLVTQALTATHFYHRDQQYVVQDSKVQIIDQSTGRLMPDRSWEQGLHQMIEAKEGCVISEIREPQARISYQRFFSRYLRIGGTSGTISEVAGELSEVYGLETVRVPPHRPNQRKMLGDRLFRDEAGKRTAMLDRVRDLHASGRPVLIGTCSVAESEQVSAWLDEAGLAHQVLNAKQDAAEADIVSRAGQPGALTVATNMAGRGTDIALGPGVKELGGLHVLALQRNDSRRVDRQLFGRCARQGDPGSAEVIASLQDTALAQFYFPAMLRFMTGFCSDKRSLPRWLSALTLRLPQKMTERKQFAVRKHLMKQDRHLRRILAFSGKFE